MEDKTNKDDEPASLEGESLEFSRDESQSNATGVTDASSQSDKASSEASMLTGPDKTPRKRKSFWARFNIYLLLFILVVVISAAIVIVLYFKNRTTETPSAATINQQKLSSDALNQLSKNGVQVGDPKQILSIQSNSVFSGTVLVKGELQVAGGLKIGSGGLSIPDLVVGGSASINQLQAQSLAIAGKASVQGQLTVQQGLSVNGGGNFNGPVTTPQLTAQKLQISGDLAITRHLTAGGSIPSRTNGSLGSGGSSSVSGSDTAGSVNINTGSGTTGGCMITVNFAQPFNSTPHIALTPVGSAAGGLPYYINRTTTSFSICSVSPPPANSSFGFDYIAFD